MSESTPLTAEQFLPFAVYAAQLAEARRLEMKVLRPPALNCPTCNEQIAEILLRKDPDFVRDECQLAVRPCGHRFTVGGETAYEVGVRAQKIAREESP